MDNTPIGGLPGCGLVDKAKEYAYVNRLGVLY